MNDDYIKSYPIIGFKVIYSYNSRYPEKLVFAAHPIEFLDELSHEEEEKEFMIAGYIDALLIPNISFKGFTIQMDKTFHKRLGELYTEVSSEFIKAYSTRG